MAKIHECEEQNIHDRQRGWGHPVEEIYVNDDGTFTAVSANGEYTGTIFFCPFCGQKGAIEADLGAGI